MELIAALTDALHLHCNRAELQGLLCHGCYYSYPHNAILVTIMCFGMFRVICYFISAPNIVACMMTRFVYIIVLKGIEGSNLLGVNFFSFQKVCTSGDLISIDS